MDKGFEMNTYDRFVEDKIMNGKQCTLLWYVEKKLSHMEAKVVEDLINALKNSFGELVVARGKKHTFWGVNINIRELKKVQIEIKEQFFEAIEVFEQSVDENLNTPA